MSKHEIEVEGLPDGWEPVAYRCPKNYEKFLLDGEIKTAAADYATEFMIVKKKQPRRVTFEETDYNNVCDLEEGVKWTFFDDKYWREVKETEEPKLCLGVEECRRIVRCAAHDLSDDILLKIYNYINTAKNNNKTS